MQNKERTRPAFLNSFCILHSSFCIRRAAYTLIELALTIAVLMIVLSMMINLANRVRREAADRLARQVLARLTTAMSDYQQQYHALPPVQPLVTGDRPANTNETVLAILARENSAGFVKYLNIPLMAKSAASADDPLRESLQNGILQDPWGSPFVFMPQQHPLIGMAPGDSPFFFSAGPDRQYLTREDNVFSYEGRE